MTDMGGYSLSDIRAVTSNENAGEFNWFWIILIFLFFLGFGGNGSLFGSGNGQLNADFITRDLFNTNQNVSAQGCQTRETIMNGTYQTQLGLQNLGTQMQNCCCETNKNIDSVRYDASKNTYDIISNATANTQKILDKLCENEINQLRSDLQSAQMQISQLSQTQNIENYISDKVIPRSIPAYITCSPYQSQLYGFNYGCGCGCGA